MRYLSPDIDGEGAACWLTPLEAQALYDFLSHHGRKVETVVTMEHGKIEFTAGSITLAFTEMRDDGPQDAG